MNSVYNNENLESSAQLVVKACSAYDARLHRFLIHQLRSRQSTLLADDLAQEVYLRLLRFKDADLIRHPQAYLYQIARNVLADRLEVEGNMRERVVFDSTIIERAQECHDDSADHDTATAFSAEDRVSEDYSKDVAEEAERARELEHILSQLPATHRRVLVLRKCEGKSYSEIARDLEISIHTVKKYVHQALVQCRLLYAR